MVGVVELKIGDQTQLRTELHQRAVRFIGFSHQQPAVTSMTIAAEAGHDAADDGGWIFASLHQKGGGQGAGGGLSVAASHGDRGLLIDQRSQQIRAMPDLQSGITGASQFRIAGGNRC